MTEPIDLDAIRARSEEFRRFRDDGAEYTIAAEDSADDVPALLAEVDRLRAGLDAPSAEIATLRADVQRLDAENDGLTDENQRLAAEVERLTAERDAPVIDAAHLAHQRGWSRQTFGPGRRTGGVLDHIRKELAEIEADPTDLGEWVDVIILAFDGAWRAGWEPQAVIDAVKAKQRRNEERTWPDWRQASEDVAIEHDRSKDAAAPAQRAQGGPTDPPEGERTGEDGMDAPASAEAAVDFVVIGGEQSSWALDPDEADPDRRPA